MVVSYDSVFVFAMCLMVAYCFWVTRLNKLLIGGIRKYIIFSRKPLIFFEGLTGKTNSKSFFFFWLSRILYMVDVIMLFLHGRKIILSFKNNKLHQVKL